MEDVKRLLAELSAAVDRAEVDDEERAELARLVTAVDQRLRGDAATEDHHHLITGLQQAEVRFEADHPALSAAVRQAIQALSAAGI